MLPDTAPLLSLSTEDWRPLKDAVNRFESAWRQAPRPAIEDYLPDSNPLRLRLKKRGILFLAPYRSNRTRNLLNDGRNMRRYRKRWKVERTFAWFGNFRRLVVRYDRHLSSYRAFFHLACLLITMRFL